MASSAEPITFLTLHKGFTDAVTESFANENIATLKEKYDELRASHLDRKAALDQSFRDLIFCGIIGDIERLKKFLDFSILACRNGIATSTIPVVLMADVFDALTLDQCELLFTYVEDNVAVWREDWIFQACKNNLLRMCNDLLRRLSRSQNTVFCGRILLFLAKFFPFSERSGLNIVSEFNLENLTEYETTADGNELSATGGGGSGGGGGNSENGSAGEDKTTPLATESSENLPFQVDYNLYCKFWALQDFFRNPNQCYNKVQWKLFARYTASVLSAFSSFKLEEQRTTSTNHNKMDKSSLGNNNEMEVDHDEQDIRESQHFFAKFLTNPKLLALQLSDSNFRRSVLVQSLILFQYLRSTVKFKSETFSLSSSQLDYIKETELQIYKLLEETPPNGKKFAKTVRHMLQREELWNNWKNEGCKEFSRPESATEDASLKLPPMKRQKRNLGDAVRDANKQNKFYMGNMELSRLWNLCPDNLQACRGDDRNFLPSIETYLENPKDKTDQSFEWRALRLLARQSPHFFSLTQTPNKVSDYLEGVRKKIHESKSRTKIEPSNSTGGASGGSGNVAGGNTDGNSGNSTANTINNTTTIAGPVSDNGNIISGATVTGNGVNNTDSQINQTNNTTQDENIAKDELVEVVDGSNQDDGDQMDDQNTHKTTVAISSSQMKELCIIIGNSWKKLATKLGFSADLVNYFMDEHPNVPDQCKKMLKIWFDEDDDANLENLAYILEGLDMIEAADAIKRILEPADKMEDISE